MMNNRNNKGFTLAEMLITVAIIMILMGVSFVAVQNYQRSSTRLEFDTIAKEIFVAAQNHLTSAESQGYLDLNATALGYPASTVQGDQGNDIYYLVSDDSASTEMLNLILPAYAVDYSGSYIIRYQPSSATVLDVFYSRPGRRTFLTVAGMTLQKDDYTSLMEQCRGDDKTSVRQNFNGAVVGWYGNEEPIPSGSRLRVPTFEIINAEKLYVNVNDPNVNEYGTLKPSLKLVITGVSSGAEAVFPLVKDGVPCADDSRIEHPEGKPFSVVLDDITNAATHFSTIPSNNGYTFFPGEDVKVKVVAYSNQVLTNIAISAEQTTNSLFADPVDYVSGEPVRGSAVEQGIAAVTNIRHLENLDKHISGYDPDPSISIDKAYQLTDFTWTDFKNATKGNSTTICYDTGETKNGTYYPVSPDYKLSYDGQRHSISDVVVDFAGPAGLFGTLSEAGSSVSNLELLDFSITSTGDNAGALVGTATGTADAVVTITNVLARHRENATTIKSDNGSAGGLIGSATNCTVEKCAAALIVEGSGSAGGLIGAADGTTVTASFSGGHTKNGSYAEWINNGTPDDTTDDHPYDVTGATAGGLIGTMIGGKVNNSYSTCSVSGSTIVGGFVGTGSGKIDNSYCTGLVSGTTCGAFAGTLSTDPENCQYFEIINEIPPEGNGYFTYLGPVAGETERGGITALDQSVVTYNAFVGDPENWATANSYDDKLAAYYQGKYNLQTVAQRGAADEIKATDFVIAHYGDWPAPEEFVYN